ncbi:MAG: DNA/RNA non-specific endonuclease [Bacteroidia bacterium]
MKKLAHGLLIVLAASYIGACTALEQKEIVPELPVDEAYLDFGENNTASASVYNGWPESFEQGSKTSYAAANVTLSTGSWWMSDALIGSLTSDRKNGTRSVRIQNSGRLRMNFNLTQGASQVTILHAKFGTDANSSWELWASTNGGSSWLKLGNTVTTTSTTLSSASFGMSIGGSVRFEIRKLGGGRLNIDDIRVFTNNTTATKDNHLTLGNPSGATTSTSNTNNYLMVKAQYALAYQNSRGSARWVSWHLSPAWLGTASRCDCFTVDNSLPSGFFRATSSHYTNTGFDRGHITPSADRNLNSSDNAATFLMSNIIPQAPNLNRQTWANLEAYCRQLINQGNELYIISGGYGQGGSGSQGGVTNTIANGAITVPSRNWKVIVVLPIGSNDVNRVTTSTRVIAVDMPNAQNVNSSWGIYRTSVDAIEASTGLNLLSNVPVAIQNVIEAVVDNGPTS